MQTSLPQNISCSEEREETTLFTGEQAMQGSSGLCQPEIIFSYQKGNKINHQISRPNEICRNTVLLNLYYVKCYHKTKLYKE